VLPALYLENGPDGRPLPVAANVPPDYLVPEPSQQSISSLIGATLAQGGHGTLTVYGTNFSSAVFVLDGSGVSITSQSVTPGQTDVAMLGLSVDPEAVPGPHAIKVGTSASVLNAVIVTWRPRVDTCDTAQLAQSLEDVQSTIVVHGHVLNGARATLSGSPLVSIASVVTADLTVTVVVDITASTYDPTDYNPPADMVEGSGPYYKPYPVHSRPPVHYTVPLVLTVTPVGGSPTSFSINLDAIR
jgi:hypothetical protein